MLLLELLLCYYNCEPVFKEEYLSITVSIGLAILPVGHLRPVAHAAVLVEPQAGAAGVLLRGPVHARVEDVAHAGVGVRVEAVQTGAQVAGTLGRL